MVTIRDKFATSNVSQPCCQAAPVEDPMNSATEIIGPEPEPDDDSDTEAAMRDMLILVHGPRSPQPDRLRVSVQDMMRHVAEGQTRRLSLRSRFGMRMFELKFGYHRLRARLFGARMPPERGATGDGLPPGQ